MGCCTFKPELSPELYCKVIALFKEIDSDGSNTIDLNETLEFWKDNFARINTNEIFKSLDKDKNQKIDLKEWIQFWVDVKNKGHSEEEILEELENLKNKGAWVHFSSKSL